MALLWCYDLDCEVYDSMVTQVVKLMTLQGSYNPGCEVYDLLVTQVVKFMTL